MEIQRAIMPRYCSSALVLYEVPWDRPFQRLSAANDLLHVAQSMHLLEALHIRAIANYTAPYQIQDMDTI